MVNAAISPSRADYYQILADTLPKDALVVTSLGNASYLWAAMHHRPENSTSKTRWVWHCRWRWVWRSRNRSGR